MKLNLNKFEFLVFIINPFLLLPTIVDLIALKQKQAYYLLALIFGLIVYMYEPTLNKDLSRYYLAYDQVSSFSSISELSFFLKRYPDRFLYVFSFLLSKVGLGFQFYALFMTFINLLLVFSIYIDLIERFTLSKQLNLLLFTFFIIMIGLGWIIGVSRQFTAFAIILYSYYFGIWKGEKKMDIFILTALIVHFSSIGLITIYYLAKYFVSKKGVIKYLFYLSFIFYFIPQGFITTIIRQNVLTNTFLSENRVYSGKVESYTLEKNEGKIKSIEENINIYGRIQTLLEFSIPFTLIVLYTLFGKIKFDNFYYLVFIFVNISNNFLSIYKRFFSFAMMVFAIFFIYNILSKKKVSFIDFMFINLMIVSSLFIFYLGYGDRMMRIFFDSHILSLVSILSKNVSYDILTY